LFWLMPNKFILSQPRSWKFEYKKYTFYIKIKQIYININKMLFKCKIIIESNNVINFKIHRILLTKFKCISKLKQNLFHSNDLIDYFEWNI